MVAEDDYERMRFAPEILRRLGEELVPHPDLGIIELVRNAYDADAERCIVELVDVEQPGGLIRVTDVGDGMTRRDIRDGFLLLGKSGKLEVEYTPKRRRKVGEKGLGRLAALRLGRTVTLRTRPRTESGVEYVLHINWDAFERVAAVEDIGLEVKRVETSEEPGTTIEIANVRNAMRPADVERLARSLVMLTGPFPGSNADFVAELRSTEFTNMEKLVGHGFFEVCDFILTASLNEDGDMQAQLSDRHGKVLVTAGTDEIMARSPDHRNSQIHRFMIPPAAELKLWLFNLNTVSFDGQGSRLKGMKTAVSKWLKEVGGFHLYHRGLRVHPYGDPGFDWLEMNALRGSNPEVRPGTNNSVGLIILGEGSNHLTPKTDRSGFVEDLSFIELREFARASLEWAAYHRVAWRDQRNQQQKRKTKARIDETRDAVNKALKLVPEAAQPIVRRAIEAERAANQERLQVIEEDLLLYRTLGTVGTTTAVFAHETLRPVDTIEQMIGSIDRRGRRELAERYEATLANPVQLIQRAAGSLRTFAELPLKLLKNRKRRPSSVDINATIVELVSTFKPYLEDAQVIVDFELSDETARVRSTISSIEAVVANILANAVAVFSALHVPNSRAPIDLAAPGVDLPAGTQSLRRVLIRTSLSPTNVLVSFLDNGPGIHQLTAEDVWLPGRTTREGGTGLGLTIVRDIVVDLQGSVWAQENGELGGAEFHVSIPRERESS